MNQVIMVGRIATDIELHTTQAGKDVAQYRIAVDRRFKQQDGPSADFFSCVSWGQSATYLHKYGAKGREICVSGRLQTRSYKAQDGSQRQVTEIVTEDVTLLGSKQEAQPQERRQQDKPKSEFVETDEPLPF